MTKRGRPAKFFSTYFIVYFRNEPTKFTCFFLDAGYIGLSEIHDGRTGREREQRSRVVGQGLRGRDRYRCENL